MLYQYEVGSNISMKTTVFLEKIVIHSKQIVFFFFKILKAVETGSIYSLEPDLERDPDPDLDLDLDFERDLEALSLSFDFPFLLSFLGLFSLLLWSFLSFLFFSRRLLSFSLERERDLELLDELADLFLREPLSFSLLLLDLDVEDSLLEDLLRSLLLLFRL